MKASHHPTDDLLLDYGAGHTDEAQSLLIATHLTLCPRCRSIVDKAETLGGALIDTAPATAMAEGALEAVLNRLDEPDDTPAYQEMDSATADVSISIPRPLRDYLAGGSTDKLSWRRIAPGIQRHTLTVESEGKTSSAYLLKLAPETVIPHHGHHGEEMTLVLEGGFTDAGQHFVRGDVEQADPAIKHQPVIDPDGPCLALVVTDAPLRFTDLLPRLLQPILYR
jgi:putative transcriptional regulator